MNFEKILSLLVAKFSGVRKDALTQLARALSLQASTEEEGQAAVEKLTAEHVNSFVKDYRADVDKEVTSGTKTFEDNLKKKYNLVEKSQPDNTPAPAPAEGDIAAIVNAAIQTAIKPLTETISALQSEKTATTRLSQLQSKLSECKDESLKNMILKSFGRMSFESDEAFQEYLTETETDITQANQTFNEQSLIGQGKPIFSTDKTTGISPAVAEFVKERTEGTPSDVGGKKLI